ncbi:MAG: tetratricopeptide repeat protein [Pyrinomonadaceae bacterium]|nr:tetratricopeptide repeat protein [Pyrinomonadaceae bacterium]
MTKKIIFGLITYCLMLTAFTALTVEVNAQKPKDLKQAKKLIDEGNKLFNQKNYRGAIDKYAQSIVLAPNLPESHFWKGYAHYYLTEYDEALTEINKAEDLNFNKPIEIYKIRWYLNYQKKNLDAAFEDVQKGLQAEPGNLTLIMASGDINRSKGNFREALVAYERAAQVNPNSGDLYYLIAISHSNLGEISEQGVAASEAIKKNTKFIGESYALLGEAMQRAKKYNEAIDAYLSSLTAKEDNYAVYRSLADIYRSQNRFQDAIDISRKGLRTFPNDGNIYTDLSWFYSLANRHEDAIQAALAAIRFLPDQSLAYTNLCRAYNDTKQYQLAISACNKALAINPNDGETNFYLGRAYDLVGKPVEATKYYDKAVNGLVEFTKSNPDYSDGFYLLGNAYFADNQQVKAIEAYQKCLELSPKFSKARFNLGIIYVLRKDKAAATEQYNALLNLDKDLAGKLKAEIDKK